MLLSAVSLIKPNEKLSVNEVKHIGSKTGRQDQPCLNKMVKQSINKLYYEF